MPNIEIMKLYCDGVHVATVLIDTKNITQSVKDSIIADPDKNGYTKDMISKLEKATILTKAEADLAKGRATK